MSSNVHVYAHMQVLARLYLSLLRWVDIFENVVHFSLSNGFTMASLKLYRTHHEALVATS